jgi:thioredoxin-like negative regulator of GroEL
MGLGIWLVCGAICVSDSSTSDSATKNAPTELDEFNFHQTISDLSGIVLVFFTGPHCASCHHLRNLFADNIQILKKNLSDNKLPFNVFEIKADKANALVNEFSVFHLPSLFLYQNGQYHCELQTQAHPQKIIEAIELALSKPAEEEP